MFGRKRGAAAVLMAALLAIPGGATAFAASPAAGDTPAGNPLAAGSSLVAADQAGIWEEQLKAHPELKGLDVTWLDFGPDIVGASINNTNLFDNPEGVFTLQLWGENDSPVIAFDRDGTVVVGPGYNAIEAFHEGLATVTKYGEMPEREPGTIPVPPSYRFGCVDRNGREVIPLDRYSAIGTFSEGLAAVMEGKGSRFGYVDKTGKEIIAPVYQSAKAFADGLAPVQDPVTQKWGYIDSKGTVKIPFKYEKADSFSEGLARVCANGKSGYVDPSGTLVIPMEWPVNYNEETAAFHEGLAAVVGEDGNYGYIDPHGKLVIDTKFYDAGVFDGGIAVCSVLTGGPQTGGTAVIDRTGRRIAALSYSQFAGERPEDGIVRLMNYYPDERFGALNLYGTEVVPFVLPEMGSFAGGACLINTNYGSSSVGILKVTPEMKLDGGNALIHVELNGKELEFADTDAVVDNGRTLVPMRAIFEAMGAEIGWDGATRTVTGTKNGVEVKLVIGRTEAQITKTAADGSSDVKTLELDVPGKIVAGRTLIPARFVAESFDAKVDWDQETKTVSIIAK